MKTVSVSQFKANPSAYFKLVVAGHSVLLFERKKPIAILRPVEPGDDEEAYRQKLIAMGIASAPTKPFFRRGR